MADFEASCRTLLFTKMVSWIQTQIPTAATDKVIKAEDVSCNCGLTKVTPEAEKIVELIAEVENLLKATYSSKRV